MTLTVSDDVKLSTSVIDIECHHHKLHFSLSIKCQWQQACNDCHWTSLTLKAPGDQQKLASWRSVQTHLQTLTTARQWQWSALVLGSISICIINDCLQFNIQWLATRWSSVETLTIKQQVSVTNTKQAQTICPKQRRQKLPMQWELQLPLQGVTDDHDNSRLEI